MMKKKKTIAIFFNIYILYKNKYYINYFYMKKIIFYLENIF